MTARTPRRYFSMIRSFLLADVFTIANGFCGVGAIFEAMKYLAPRRAGDPRSSGNCRDARP